MAAVDVSPEQDGGIIKEIIKEGVDDEKPMQGSTVFVHYVGTLADTGDKFDSSRDRNEEFKFTLGKEQVIKGWDLGVATMKRGEIAKFTIKPEFAYGKSGSPPKIPANATLVFEVELIRWQSEDISPDRDGSITRDLIVKGEDLANPSETSEVTVHIVGRHEGRVFYDRDLKYALGEGSEVGLPQGVDRAIRRFERGEKSIIHLKGSRYTYGSNPPPEFNLPPNAALDFTIFLKEYEKVPSSWELTADEKIAAANLAKEKGTEFFKQGKYLLAVNKYKRIEDLLEYEKNTDENVRKQRDALMLAAYLNLALAYSKMGEELQCTQSCDKALELDPKNVKALYRKATALLSFSEFENAQKIFESVVALDPENKAAQQQILVCKQRVKEYEEKERKRFRGMFSKLAKDTPEVPEQKNPFEVVPDEAGPSGAPMEA